MDKKFYVLTHDGKYLIVKVGSNGVPYVVATCSTEINAKFICNLLLENAD